MMTSCVVVAFCSEPASFPVPAQAEEAKNVRAAIAVGRLHRDRNKLDAIISSSPACLRAHGKPANRALVSVLTVRAGGNRSGTNCLVRGAEAFQDPGRCRINLSLFTAARAEGVDP